MEPHQNPRKAVIAAIVLILLLLAGAVAFSYLRTPAPLPDVVTTATPTPSASATPSTTPSPSAKAAFQFSHAGFVFANENDATDKKFTFSQYDLSSQKLVSATFPGDNSLDLTQSLSDATGVQLSADGNVLAYSYNEIGGMSGPSNENASNLVVIQADGTKVYVVQNGLSGTLGYWKLLPDGQSLVYVQNSDATENAKAVLWKYTFATKKAEKVLDDVSSYLADDGISYDSTAHNLIFLTYKDRKLDEHTVNIDTKVVNEKLLYTAANDGIFGGEAAPFVLSPNQKFLAQAVENSNGTSFDLNVVTIATGTVTTLINSGDTASFSLAGWSPDSSTIAVTKYFFGAGSDQTIIPEIWLVDINTKAKTVVASGTIDSGFESIGNKWSPDGKYFIYTDDKTLSMYNVSTKKSVKIYDIPTRPNGTVPIAWAGF